MTASPKSSDAELKPPELIRGGLADYLHRECTVLGRGHQHPLVTALSAVEDAARELLQDYEDAVSGGGVVFDAGGSDSGRCAPRPRPGARAPGARVMDRVVEYLCTNTDCKLKSPWHPFDSEAMALEEPGEYTVTLRVREVGKKRRARKRR